MERRGFLGLMSGLLSFGAFEKAVMAEVGVKDPQQLVVEKQLEDVYLVKLLDMPDPPLGDEDFLLNPTYSVVLITANERQAETAKLLLTFAFLRLHELGNLPVTLGFNPTRYDTTNLLWQRFDLDMNEDVASGLFEDWPDFVTGTKKLWDYARGQLLKSAEFVDTLGELSRQLAFARKDTETEAKIAEQLAKPLLSARTVQVTTDQDSSDFEEIVVDTDLLEVDRRSSFTGHRLERLAKLYMPNELPMECAQLLAEVLDRPIAVIEHLRISKDAEVLLNDSVPEPVISSVDQPESVLEMYRKLRRESGGQPVELDEKLLAKVRKFAARRQKTHDKALTQTRKTIETLSNKLRKDYEEQQ